MWLWFQMAFNCYIILKNIILIGWWIKLHWVYRCFCNVLFIVLKIFLNKCRKNCILYNNAIILFRYLLTDRFRTTTILKLKVTLPKTDFCVTLLQITFKIVCQQSTWIFFQKFEYARYLHSYSFLRKQRERQSKRFIFLSYFEHYCSF